MWVTIFKDAPQEDTHLKGFDSVITGIESGVAKTARRREAEISGQIIDHHHMTIWGWRIYEN